MCNESTALSTFFQSTLMRHSTPHPKELRSRYSRPLTFDRDANSNVNRNSVETGECSQRATDTTTNVAAPDVVACSQQQVTGVISPLYEGRQDATLLVSRNTFPPKLLYWQNSL